MLPNVKSVVWFLTLRGCALVQRRECPTAQSRTVPADRHSQGCDFSFAEGHAERWRWKAAKGPATSGSDGDKADVRALQAVSLQ